MKTGILVSVQNRESLTFDLAGQVKDLLFLDVDQYAGLIARCVDRAIDDVERFTGLAIGVQTRRVSYSILTEETVLPYGPFREVVDLTSGGAVDQDGRLLAVWPAGGSITYKCGYDADDLPAPAGLLGAVAMAAAEYTGLNPAIKTDAWKPLARRYRTFTWAA